MKLVSSGMEKLRDPLYRNAFFLVVTSAFGGVFGFTFWLIVARYYTSDAVGLSASLVALAGFLGYLSTLGLGIGLIRFLPSTSVGKNHRINASLTLTGLASTGVALAFIAGVDLWSPIVTVVGNSWSYAIMFLAFTVGFALMALVDSSFLAARKASYVLHRSLIYNGLRLPIPILVATSLGALGIFFSFGVALLLALLVSLLFLMPRLYPGFVAMPSLQLSGIRDMISYSIGNHAANLLGRVPSGILPLLVLHQLSASSSAHFYIAWIMASFLFVVPRASAQSLFIEGSHPETHLAGDAVRSLRFSLLLLVPGVLFLLFAGPFLLGLFGEEYSTEGLALLRILVLSAFFVAINSTFFSILRVNKRVGELTLLSSVVGVGTVAASYLLLDGFGMMGPGIAFLSIQAAISGYVLLRNLGASKRVAKGLMRF
ncbi:MAG: hypothetical protein LN412_04855 [Candidatus Thermoplasmatota archaeon]|nr:hypothetical protein [Candidatus Thermoplasmatota archaeon]